MSKLYRDICDDRESYFCREWLYSKGWAEVLNVIDEGSRSLISPEVIQNFFY